MVESRARAVQAFNNIAAMGEDNYVSTDLGIKTSNEETKNIISSTFGVIKNNLDALWYSVGLDPNVNNAYEKVMMDPNLCIEVQGKKFYQHPGVGNLRAYNEMGNPSGGCFTMQTMG